MKGGNDEKVNGQGGRGVTRPHTGPDTTGWMQSRVEVSEEVRLEAVSQDMQS